MLHCSLSKPDIALQLFCSAAQRRRLHSPDLIKSKHLWEGFRVQNMKHTIWLLMFVSHHSIGCMWLVEADLFLLAAVAHPPDSCNTTLTVPQDPWGQLVQLRPLLLLLLLRQLRLLDPLHLDHPAPPSVQADLQVPPPHWNNSKWFYSLNIRNRWMKMTPFVLCDYYVIIM
jgi:hypothetical protein